MLGLSPLSSHCERDAIQAESNIGNRGMRSGVFIVYLPTTTFAARSRLKPRWSYAFQAKVQRMEFHSYPMKPRQLEADVVLDARSHSAFTEWTRSLTSTRHANCWYCPRWRDLCEIYRRRPTARRSLSCSVLSLGAGVTGLPRLETGNVGGLGCRKTS